LIAAGQEVALRNRMSRKRCVVLYISTYKSVWNGPEEVGGLTPDHLAHGA